MTPEPRFSGFMLDHQDLEELELKYHPKTAVFDQIWLFLIVYFGSGSFEIDGRAPNSYILGLGSHTDPQIPLGTLGWWSSV